MDVFRGTVFGGDELPDSDDQEKVLIKSGEFQALDNEVKARIDYRQDQIVNFDIRLVDGRTILVKRTTFVKKDNQWSVGESLPISGTFAQFQALVQSNQLNEKQLKLLNAEDAVQVESTTYKFETPKTGALKLSIVNQTSHPEAYEQLVGNYSGVKGSEWAKGLKVRAQEMSGIYADKKVIKAEAIKETFQDFTNDLREMSRPNFVKSGS